VSAPPLLPVRLRCAHKAAPLAVEADHIRFSWALEVDGAGRGQVAYQVVVEDDERASPSVGPLWDSGREPSAASTGIAYSGPALSPAHAYRWQVRVWDEQGQLGPWSRPATFETALGGPEAWEACWIGLGHGPGHFGVPSGDGLADPVTAAMRPAPYLRRSFAIEGEVAKARLYATALGVYELTANGQRVGDAVLAPGWTDYNRRLLYQAYDVTGLLLHGENVLGAVVADGWACGFFGFDAKRRGAHYSQAPQLLAQLVVRYRDGRQEVVGTDERWQSSTGAVKYADLLMGERREAELEPDGWDRPGYDASAWRPVICRERQRRELGGPILLADPGPPVRVTEEIPAKSVTRLLGGKLIADFGQNLAGWSRLVVKSPAGTVITARHGEMLNEDGSLYLDNLRTARQTDSYVARGGREVLAPRFTFHGFRYAEIEGLGEDPEPGDVSARVAHSEMERTGWFECSSGELNRLYANIDWGQRGNFISIPTDCPQRDERLGWLGDAQIFARTAAYNRDVAAFFSKWLDDVADSQLPSGAYPDYAPHLGYDLRSAGSPAWADAGIIVPWTMYKMYGDRSDLERNFASMEAWMGYLERNNPYRLWENDLGSNYGDWLAPKGDPTPPELVATAYWAYDAFLMAEVAHETGRAAKAKKYRQLAQEIRLAFQQAFIKPDGSVGHGTQTGYALALYFGLVPDDLKAASAAALVSAIEAEDWHLTTGFVGVGYLLPALSANSYSDIAYRVLEQKSFPSWLYTVDRGATTIWERWDGWTEEGGFQSPKMNSFNHYSLGSVGEWLYRYVLGIELAPGAAGFDRLVVRPHPGGSLSYARGSYKSARGEIRTAWRREGGELEVDVELPPNVTASVRIPSASPVSVVGPDGRGPTTVAHYPGALGELEAVFEVGSGRYSFTGPDLPPRGARGGEGGHDLPRELGPVARARRPPQGGYSR